jgi:hypothetical protein
LNKHDDRKGYQTTAAGVVAQVQLLLAVGGAESVIEKEVSIHNSPSHKQRRNVKIADTYHVNLVLVLHRFGPSRQKLQVY